MKHAFEIMIFKIFYMEINLLGKIVGSAEG